MDDKITNPLLGFESIHITNKIDPLRGYILFGGERGIRTLGIPKDSTDFESAPFDHSGISPLIKYHNVMYRLRPSMVETSFLFPNSVNTKC